MQDEYIKAIEKIQMDKDRKIEMRKVLEQEMASAPTKKPAKTTRLSSGKKAAAAAAAIVITMTVVMCIPTTRNAIYAAAKAIFNKPIPEGAIDESAYESSARAERVIPSDIPDYSSHISEVEKRDKEEDEHMKKITVSKPDYFKDDTLNELAKNYMEQGYNIMMLEKGCDLIHYFENFKEAEWYTEGFWVSYHIGDNATGYSGYTFVFKATEKQLQGYLENQHLTVNMDREDHNQKKVKFDDFWKKSTDAEGNVVYKASWKGPEPTTKLLPSDRARFTNYELTYDPASHIAVCVIEDGGGVG